MQNSLYKLFELKFVGSVCTQPPYNDQILILMFFFFYPDKW